MRSARTSLALLATAMVASLAGPAAHAADPTATPAAPFDLNGDGRVDVVAGVPTWDHEDRFGAVREDSGAVVVLWGGRNLLPETLLTQASAGVPGDPQYRDRFGHAVASADFDRDGYADLAVGAPEDETAAGLDGTFRRGSVTIFYGSVAGLGGRVSQVLNGGHREFGAALVAADVTGDGYPDLAVGSPGDAPRPDEAYGSGAVVVLRGGPAGFATERSYVVPRPDPALAAFGSVLAAGDPDLDGDVDVVEGFGGQPRRVEGVAIPGHTTYLEGASSGPRAARVLGGRAAASLAVGDVTGDGFDDVVVGTPVSRPYRPGGPLPPGRVTLFAGSPVGPAAPGVSVTQDSPGVPGRETSGDRFGASVDLADIDRDGRLDVVVGSPGEDRGAGRVTILRGVRSGFATRYNVTLDQASPEIPGRPEPGDRFGAEVSLLDLNGDGRKDLVIGSPGEDRRRGTVTIVQMKGIFYVRAGVRSYSLESLGRRHGGAAKQFGAVLGG